MNKDAGGGRKSFELMGGTQDQESCTFLKSFIWRTVSFQALPKKILALRLWILFGALTLLAVDCFDAYLYAQDFQYYTSTQMSWLNAMKKITDCNMMYDASTTVAYPTVTTNITECPITLNVTQQMMMDTGYTMLP